MSSDAAWADLGRQFQTIGQWLGAWHDRDPRIFWSLIAMAVGEFVLVGGIFLGILIVVPKLQSWVAARLVKYVKRRYPDEWHLPANRRLLGFVYLLALFVCVAILMVSVPSALTIWGPLVLLALLLFSFGAFTVGELERQLTAQAIHPFVPRNGNMRNLLFILDAYHVLTPGVLRVCRWLRIIPTADLIAWPCRICGEPEASARHGFPGPQKAPLAEKATASKKRFRHKPAAPAVERNWTATPVGLPAVRASITTHALIVASIGWPHRRHGGA